MKKISTTLAVSFFFLSAFSQTILKPTINTQPQVQNGAKRTPIIIANRINIPTALSSIDTSLFPIIAAVSPREKTEVVVSKDFEAFKDTATLIYTPQLFEFEPRTPIPFIEKQGFDANKGPGVAPLDNSIGCSGKNYIISVTNNFIEYYDNSTLKLKSNLGSFINYSMPSPCDPKVYFDQSVNKFIIFFQKCDQAIHINSEILIGFSISDNPLDGWNFYKFSGNPLNKEFNWFDYPKIGITTDGLYISGNVFIGPSGAGGFDQTIVYQIDKNLGFSGQPLMYRVWYDIADKPFTVMPVSYAYNNAYGKGAFLLSSRMQNNSNYIKLYDITGDIYDNNATMNFYRVPTTPYNYFAKAAQSSQVIDNGDMRIQDALMSNNKIYYVFTSGNNNNFSRTNFNILDIPTLQNRSILIGDKGNYSYCYPSLHMFSEETESPSVMLLYNGTSNTSFPDIRCKTCDDNFDCSKEFIIKDGRSTINGYDYRWGDYSCISKNQTNKHQLWLSSSYGFNNGRQAYISNIVSSNEPAIPVDSILSNQLYSPSSVSFSLPKQTDIQVVLKTGNSTTTIFEGKADKGNNIFELYTNGLKKGEYIIEVLKKNSTKKLNTTTFENQ